MCKKRPWRMLFGSACEDLKPYHSLPQFPFQCFFSPPVVTDIVHSRCPQFQKECVLFITVMNLAINYPTSSFLSPCFPSIPFFSTELIDSTVEVLSLFSLQLKCQGWSSRLLHLLACSI